ncbi:MAG: ABC transporter permease [Lentisphaeria bacterium]
MKYKLRKIGAVATTAILELFRRRDVYVAVILALVVILPLASVNIFGVEGIVRYLRETTLLLVWLFSIVIVITNAARQIPGERQRRTILPLLSKPISRAELMLGKFTGAATAASLTLLLFYAGYFLLTAFKSGHWGGLVLVQAVILHILFACLLTAMTLFGSMLLTPSANITVCLLIAGGMMLYGGNLSQMAINSPAPASWGLWICHFIIPHFEFFDLRLRLVHNWPALGGWTMLTVCLYALLFTAVFLMAAVITFRKKQI